MKVSFNKVILLLAVFLFAASGNKLSAQSKPDSLAGFNEDSVRNASLLGLPPLTQPIPMSDIEGFMKFKRAEYAGKRNGTWEQPIQQMRTGTTVLTCENADFEAGTFNTWSVATGSVSTCCSTSGTFSGTSGLVSGRQTIVTGAGLDPIGGFPIVAPGGTFSARLGNNINGGQAEQLTKTFLVTASTKIYTYKYAVVLEDPGHPVSIQPYFIIEMFDQSGALIPCSYFKVVSGQGLPGFISNPSYGAVYKPWTTNTVDLSAYVGQNIRVSFTTGDCGAGGHFGYAYIDGTCEAGTITAEGNLCSDKPINFSGPTGNHAGETYLWNFGDGTTSTSEFPSHTYTSPGAYTVTLTVFLSGTTGCDITSTTSFVIKDCRELPCVNCIGSFAPEAGDYILSAWVKEAGAVPATLTYLNPQIYIEFPTDPTLTSFTSTPLGPFTAKGAIIDGWQRIEEKIQIPTSATYINIKLNSLTGDCFYDDIRIFPIAGSMKSYVYDPVNLRLVAELDERNYATMYEYDEEGKLIRVKKETEKGIMTIKENKNNTKKK